MGDGAKRTRGLGKSSFLRGVGESDMEGSWYGEVKRSVKRGGLGENERMQADQFLASFPETE